MSAFTPEAAQIERGTAVHRHSSARILTIYVHTARADEIETGFPVSGDMLAVLKHDSEARAARRRRLAARAASTWEATR